MFGHCELASEIRTVTDLCHGMRLGGELRAKNSRGIDIVHDVTDAHRHVRLPEW